MRSSAQFFDQPDDASTWDSLVVSSGGHVLQSWAWGQLKSGFGWHVQRLKFGSARAQILYRNLPGGLGTIAYVPKGPVVDSALSSAGQVALQELLEAIQPHARRMRAICLKIEPDEVDDPALARRLMSMGFEASPQPIQPGRTIAVDLQGEPDAILQRMKQKTRYNIRLAGRKGVTIRAGEEGDLQNFYDLMETTAERDGFGIHSQAYYETVYRLFVQPGRGCLLLAEHEGKLLAGLVVMATGDTACYMYGASSSESRNLMPTYLLQWQAMLWAREQGCHVYDLWGVPDEEESTLESDFTKRSDGLWGVYRFKRGFGGRLVRTIGAWDLVYSPLRYQLYKGALGWLNRRQAD